jgi:serine/threonine-protein kinase
MLDSTERRTVTSDDSADDREDRLPWASMAKYLIATICGIFLILVLMDKVVMPWYVKLGAVETVPNVVGMQFSVAEHRLQDLGFEVKKGEPRFDNRYPAGMVVMQLPYGGSQTKQGRRIYLTVSRGAELLPMLDLEGMPMREARIALMRLGFDIGEVTYDYNDTIMRDLIYAQSIPPKAGARPGTKVDVQISRGPSTRFTMMPNLISVDVETARVRLQNAGLVLGVLRSKEDQTYIKNTVIEQSVAPYSQVAQGAAINLTIATEPGSDGDGGSGTTENEPTVRNLLPR